MSSAITGTGSGTLALTTAGQTVTLQMVATTVSYASPRLGGAIAFSAVKASLPVTFGLRSA